MMFGNSDGSVGTAICSLGSEPEPYWWNALGSISRMTRKAPAVALGTEKSTSFAVANPNALTVTKYLPAARFTFTEPSAPVCATTVPDSPLNRTSAYVITAPCRSTTTALTNSVFAVTGDSVGPPCRALARSALAMNTDAANLIALMCQTVHSRATEFQCDGLIGDRPSRNLRELGAP